MTAANRSPSPPQRSFPGRRLAAFGLAWIFAAAVYLLLIDTTDEPELIVGAVAALLGALATELARTPDAVSERAPRRALARLYRPALRVPADTVLLARVVIAAILGRRPAGGFRAVAFRSTTAAPHSGRRALAEIAGSLAPNTIVVGIDAEAERLIVHQLHAGGGRRATDPLELG